MRVVTTLEDVRDQVRSWKRAGLSIGLVPTMGYLHEGHASLIERARAENDCVVVSVFLNPTQFAPEEDLDRYPRDFAHDCAACEDHGADLVFHPAPEEMYRDPHAYVSIDLLSDTLDGAARPVHFRGVCTVVSKLFNIVQPDRAYFGEKDAQQLAIVRKFVADLNFPIEIVGCPIVREPDGLAKSSRNTYITSAERKAAPVLYRAITVGKRLITPGMSASELEAAMKRVLAEEPLARTEYVSAVDAATMKPVKVIDRDVLVALAVRIGKTRLIDNFSYRLPRHD